MLLCHSLLRSLTSADIQVFLSCALFEALSQTKRALQSRSCWTGSALYHEGHAGAQTLHRYQQFIMNSFPFFDLKIEKPS